MFKIIVAAALLTMICMSCISFLPIKDDCEKDRPISVLKVYDNEGNLVK